MPNVRAASEMRATQTAKPCKSLCSMETAKRLVESTGATALIRQLADCSVAF
jgi:hypothetical protein